MKQSHHLAVSTMTVLVLELVFLFTNPTLASDTGAFGGGGGNPFRDECPKGSYLVGLKGRAGEWVDRIAPICAQWIPKSQAFGKPFLGPFHGASRGGVERERSCWGFGVNNRAIQSWQLERLSSDNFIKYIKAQCVSLAPPAATATLSFGGPITEDQGKSFFETAGTTGADFFSAACPPGELAIGIHGSAGNFLDSIGLICGPLPSRMIPPATNVTPHAMAPVPPATNVNPLAMAPATAAGKANPLAVSPVTDDMFTILKPVQNDRVVQGQLIVTAMQPKIGLTPVSELEFKWLDAPPSQPFINVFAVETPKLLAGYPVAQAVTRGYAGRWEIRARASGKTPPGPWSLPVQFRLELVQPTQSQQQAPPMMQQAPLPSPSVMQAPAPSSATTPMRHSPSMIMPRGVDEKGGKEGTETVDPPAEGIQQP